MAKRCFLQLGHPYVPAKHTINGWMVSEKLDGIRAFWDGGISRGLPTSEVPWANTEKDFIRVKPPISTGLWSRYGKVIHAPDWFLDQLPEFQLDGELWAGPGRHQFVTSTVKDIVPGNGWFEIKYAVFDIPPLVKIFADGEINEIHFKKKFKGCVEWATQRAKEQPPSYIHTSFEATYKFLQKQHFEGNVYLLPQVQLPFNTVLAAIELENMLKDVLERKGEGLIIRRHVSSWIPERTQECLKYKPYDDAEGTVVGYIWGRETDKGSKLLGMMGAMIVKLDNGKKFELSGFTDEERTMCFAKQDDGYAVARAHGANHAGQEVHPEFHNPRFPIGSRVTFRFRDYTNDGIPKEARFLRKRED